MLRKNLAIVFIAYSLTGCGGGGGSSKDSTSKTSEKPPPFDLGITANTSINSTTSYVNQKATFRLNRRYGFENVAIGLLQGFYHGVAYGDFDNDGDIDFIQSGANGQDLQRPHFYRQSTDGNFEMEDSFISGGNGMVHPRKAIVADFDNNQIPDVVTFGHGFDWIPFPGEASELYLSDGINLTYSNQLESYIGFFHSGAAGDIDNDGDIDILMNAPGDGGGLYFLINDGNANFSKVTNRFSEAINYNDDGWYEYATITCELYDINGDGFLDVIAGAGDNLGAGSYILYGDSTGYYQTPHIIPTVAGLGVVVDIDADDTNGDGFVDLVLTRTSAPEELYSVVGSYNGFYVQLLTGTSDGTFIDQSTLIEKRTSWVYFGSSLTPDSLTSVSIGSLGAHAAGGSPEEWIDWIRLQDVNDDGYVDIIEDQDYRNLTWLNNGDGSFSAQFELIIEDQPGIEFTFYGE